MKKVKITVLKTMFFEDLAKEYGAEGLTACPFLREGQVFYADYARPDGFCDEAWKAIYQYVFALQTALTLALPDFRESDVTIIEMFPFSFVLTTAIALPPKA